MLLPEPDRLGAVGFMQLVLETRNHGSVVLLARDCSFVHLKGKFGRDTLDASWADGTKLHLREKNVDGAEAMAQSAWMLSLAIRAREIRQMGG